MTLDFKFEGSLYQVAAAQPPEKVVLPNKKIVKFQWMRFGATFEALHTEEVPHNTMDLKCWEIGAKYEIPLAMAKGR